MCLCPFTHDHEQIPGWKPWGRHCCLQSAGSGVFSQHEPLAASHRKESWCSEQGITRVGGVTPTWCLAVAQMGRAQRRWNPYLRQLSRVPFASAELRHFTLKEDVAPYSSSFVQCSYSRSLWRLRLQSYCVLFETSRPVHLLLLTVHLAF